MSEYKQNEGSSVPSPNEQALALWLQALLAPPSDAEGASSAEARSASGLELHMGGHYHVHFYQQLPDFCMALLTDDPQATARYAPLLYHLVMCQECHSAYLDVYDSLRAALYPQGIRPVLGQGTRTLDATPHRMLSHLCQTLISQAEALLYQARHEHSDADQAARGLLRLALRVSSHIAQSTTRREALHDLVRIATLFDGPSAPSNPDEQVYAYSANLVGSGSMRSSMLKTRRQAGGQSSEVPMIQLKARNLEGIITQRGQTLELHLQELDPLLRGRFVCINIALGSLFEPVRWRGGNPRSIKSVVPVDATGTLVTPLGETELELSKPEERNLLEALFLLVQVRACDQEAG